MSYVPISTYLPSKKVLLRVLKKEMIFLERRRRHPSPVHHPSSVASPSDGIFLRQKRGKPHVEPVFVRKCSGGEKVNLHSRTSCDHQNTTNEFVLTKFCCQNIPLLLGNNRNQYIKTSAKQYCINRTTTAPRCDIELCNDKPQLLRKLDSASHTVKSLEQQVKEMRLVLAEERQWRREEEERQLRGRRGVIVGGSSRIDLVDVSTTTISSSILTATSSSSSKLSSIEDKSCQTGFSGNVQARVQRRWKRIKNKKDARNSLLERVNEVEEMVELTARELIEEKCAGEKIDERNQQQAVNEGEEAFENTATSFHPPSKAARIPLVSHFLQPEFTTSSHNYPHDVFAPSNSNFLGFPNSCFTHRILNENEGFKRPFISQKHQWYTDFLTVMVLNGHQRGHQPYTFGCGIQSIEDNTRSALSRLDSTGWIYDQRRNRIKFEYARALANKIVD